MATPADAALRSGRRSAAPAALHVLQPAASAAPASEGSTGQCTKDARQPDVGPLTAPRVFRQRRKPALDAGHAPVRMRAPLAGLAPAKGAPAGNSSDKQTLSGS